MRFSFEQQPKLNQILISDVEIDISSRDEIPQILIGLQHIFENKSLRDKIFDILLEAVPENISIDRGRRGMDMWTILVLGTVRLNCNWDYDKVHEIANNHLTLRKMLGHGLKMSGNVVDDGVNYALQTIKDNVSLLTPDLLDRINELVVKEGHKLLSKTDIKQNENDKNKAEGKDNETKVAVDQNEKTDDEKNENDDNKLHCKCDSYVLETDVHFPTDINLLYDAVRVMIKLIAALCGKLGITEWRQSIYYIGKIKKYYRVIMKLKRSTSKDETKKAQRDQQIKDAYSDYIELVESYVIKCKKTIQNIQGIESETDEETLKEICEKIEKAELLLDQIDRRAIKGETIPHDEKIFSIFEEHTEWIKKGKAGVLVELGVRVSILEDQHGFILNHIVMEKMTDDKVAVEIVTAAQEKFPNISSCSFDKGYYTPSNRRELSEILETVVMPKKGKLNKSDAELEKSDEFIRIRKKHSGVESAINALENHGLDRCPDHGIDGFKRYVSLGILARNIQKIGQIIQKKEQKKESRKKKIQETWNQKKAA
ncbi:MAG: transposase IS4 family protein [Candidatus Magnetoglobus multicellularis str. Araruama]|uniref:Transposase IS4 family protein n=1 Tax=Candidatus Magnetoglobus multicellularis str. Araruama TaxID=890399 RepID=A0A1V1NYF1_9BACT|nr:MAG: transposase IS4 family protein [Candidatus Magnetoglobus multicellularis str. Araruama]